MFRRRMFLLRRPRLLGAALVGGLGFAAGRASKGSAAGAGQIPGVAPAGPDLTVQLQNLSDLHASGALSDEEFAAAKSKLIAS
jgi:hypothetical protein